MDVSGLTKLDLAEIALDTAQVELEVQQFICRELETAIKAVQDFCEDTEHRQAILNELTEFHDGADNRLNVLLRKLSAAESFYEDAKRSTT